jgi:hypothetical protein
MCGAQWLCAGHNDYVRGTMVVCGAQWLCAGHNGCVRGTMVMCGAQWLCAASIGGEVGWGCGPPRGRCALSRRCKNYFRFTNGFSKFVNGCEWFTGDKCKTIGQTLRAAEKRQRTPEDASINIHTQNDQTIEKRKKEKRNLNFGFLSWIIAYGVGQTTQHT